MGVTSPQHAPCFGWKGSLFALPWEHIFSLRTQWIFLLPNSFDFARSAETGCRSQLLQKGRRAGPSVEGCVVHSLYETGHRTHKHHPQKLIEETRILMNTLISLMVITAECGLFTDKR